MLVVAVANPLPESGKTATALELSAALERRGARGRRVFPVDLGDGRAFSRIRRRGREHLRPEWTLADFLASSCEDQRRVFEKLAELDFEGAFVPADVKTRAEVVDLCAKNPAALLLFRRSYDVNFSRKFDVLLFDTPSNPGPVTSSAILAADIVLVPVRVNAAGHLVAPGELAPLLAQTRERLADVNAQTSTPLPPPVVVLFLYGAPGNPSAALREELDDFAARIGAASVGVRIRLSPGLVAAHASGYLARVVASRSYAAQDFRRLASALFKR